MGQLFDSEDGQPGSRARRRCYLLLLVVGIVAPYSQFLPWAEAHGLDLARFREELFANRISSFFAVDLLIAVPTLLVLALADEELRAGQRWLVAGGSLFGASVGLPLYLVLCEGNRLRASRAA